MLRAKITNGPFILGLDSENVERLRMGQPILVALSEIGGTDDILIMYGDTLDDIQVELSKHFKLPEPTIIGDADD